MMCLLFVFFFFKQKTAYEMRISDWSSDVCSSDLQHLHLVLEGQAVAGLDLDGGHALGREVAQAGQGGGVECVHARLAGLLDGVADAAAGARDLVVGGAGQAKLEIAGPVAAVDQMRGAVDEAGGEPGAAGHVGSEERGVE